ncbi:hypothetical protein GF319_01630 [Candidatus Bathyarchaeota archaeon]|nr:hypothetical protein [Candidatus Bathyarchaeota archaeon]
MSEQRIRELSSQLVEKQLEQAHNHKNKSEVIQAVRLDQEIINLKREINNELDVIRGIKKMKVEYSE